MKRRVQQIQPSDSDGITSAYPWGLSSVLEGFENLGLHFPLVFSVGSDGNSITGKQIEKSSISHRLKHKKPAFINCIGNRYSMSELAVVMNRRDTGNHERDIIGQDKPGEYFLPDEISTNAMEVIHSDTILQKKEGCFNFPAQMI